VAIDVQETRELKERVVEINRVAKVVKGGRRFSFTALVVIGDEVDRVGIGYVLELGGIRDVLAKSLGTTNPINMLKAAEVALRQLRRPEEVAKARGKQISDVLPYKAEEVSPDGEAEADASA
jgi:ribosomal protein S5